jgi:hypothetical protein
MVTDIERNVMDWIIRMVLTIVVVVLLIFVMGSHEHGMLMDPVNRSSMWRKGYKTPENYEDNQLFCGGRSVSSNALV